MLGRREYEGQWWFPQQPENKFQGRLIFTPEEGSSLNLLVFQVNTKEIPEEKTDLILGSSSDGKKITLYKCFLKAKKQHGLKLESTRRNLHLFQVSFLLVLILTQLTKLISMKCPFGLHI